MKKLLFLLLASITLFSCRPFSHYADGPGKPISHELWNNVLKAHVNDQGWVDYKAVKKDKDFEGYLDLLSNNPPQKSWSADEKEAYWINAYNAFTVKLIEDHYPVKSIKDIGPKHQIVFINTPWQIKFIKIGNKKLKLDQIEHKILRKQFDDPRIHFAVVCASRSCARLRNEAYTGDKLQAQLDDQTKSFLANTAKNKLSENMVSPYFKWYKKDFTDKGTVVDFINKYSKTKLKAGSELTYTDYDWNLNEQK